MLYILHFIACCPAQTALTCQPSAYKAEKGYLCLEEQLRLWRDEVWHRKNIHESTGSDERRAIKVYVLWWKIPTNPRWSGFSAKDPHLWLSIDMQSANTGCTDPKITVITATRFFLRVRLWSLQARRSLHKRMLTILTKCTDIFWELLHSFCCVVLYKHITQIRTAKLGI